MSDTDDMVCICPFCEKAIWNHELYNQEVAENKIYKCGELSYIELAHIDCAPPGWFD